MNRPFFKEATSRKSKLRLATPPSRRIGSGIRTHGSLRENKKYLFLTALLVEAVGLEPTQPEGNRFTVCSGSPTPAYFRFSIKEATGEKSLYFNVTG
jgi:hypothetical protein